MRTGERIIPFSKKDIRKIRRLLARQVLRDIAHLLVLLLLAVAFWVSYHHAAYALLTGASMAVYVMLMVVDLLFPVRPKAFRLWKDLKMEKKRVIWGDIEMVRYHEMEPEKIFQYYKVGHYQFELGELSPLLKRFKTLMPGQVIEVHQCLHSGIVLKLELLED